jgi:hypothetical protein
MSTQQSLFEERNAPKVGTLNSIVLGIISDGRWRTPWELCDIILRDHKVRVSDSSLTARLRDLKKAKYGAYDVVKQPRAGSRAYEYRIAKG